MGKKGRGDWTLTEEEVAFRGCRDWSDPATAKKARLADTREDPDPGALGGGEAEPWISEPWPPECERTLFGSLKLPGV